MMTISNSTPYLHTMGQQTIFYPTNIHLNIAGQQVMVEGFGKGKVMSWARRTATTYSQLRTNKGALQAWRYKIGKAESPECRHCGKAAETGDRLVFVCEE